jgi:hypothetical protein
MATLAEFETAPAGTERRPSSSSNWVTALVGDQLSDGSESRNIQGNNYQVRLNSDAGIFFVAPTMISLSNLNGTVKYKPAGGGDWAQASEGAQYTVLAVGTAIGGGGSIVCSGQGAFRPKPWP